MKQMTRYFIIIAVSFWSFSTLFTSCYTYPSAICNELKFNDPIENVADSIKTFERIIVKPLKKGDTSISNFYVDHHGNLIINNRKVWGWEGIKNDSSLISDIQELKRFSIKEKQRLINLFSFLMSNEISGGYIPYSADYFDFSYRELGDNCCSGEHIYRSIYVQESKTKHSSDSDKIIYDKKHGIVLYGPNLDLLK